MSRTRHYIFLEVIFIVSFVMLVPMLVLFVMARSAGLHDMLARSVSSGGAIEAIGYDSVRREVTEYLFGHGELAATIFSAREIVHMHDVRILFMSLTIVLAMGAVVCIGTLLYLRSQGASLANIARRVTAWGLIATVALGSAMTLFFDQLFIWFHQALFMNDYWLLDPAKDIIIRAYPPDFFRQFSILTFFVIIAVYASVWIALAVSKKR